jgi:hypothetical protein
VLANQIPEKQEEVKQFRKDYGSTKVGDVTVDMVSSFNLSIILLTLKCSKKHHTIVKAHCCLAYLK